MKGKFTTVERLDPQFGRLSSIRVDLGKLVTSENVRLWKDFTEKSILNPRKKFRGITFSEEGILRKSIYVPTLPGKLEEIKFSFISATVDNKDKSDFHYPPDPESGRPRIKIGALDIHTDSRNNLINQYDRLTRTNLSLRDRINIAVKQSILGSDAIEDKFVENAIEQYEQTPLFVLSLISRNTFYDKEREEYQPINSSGILIYERLDGEIDVFRLAPWESHITWEEIEESSQKYIATRYYQHIYPLLDKNLRKLGMAITQGLT